MTGRLADRGWRILAAVSLLLAVTSTPIRPTRVPHSAASPDRLPRDFVILNIGYSGPSAMTARLSPEEEGSLPSDIEDERDADLEDELTGSSPPAPGSFDRPPSPCPEACSVPIDFAPPPAARPLRC